MVGDESVHVAHDIFKRSPVVAYAMLGYVEGRLRAQCKPPKDRRYRPVYLREYSVGLEQGKAK
jgi:hypothetical protein